MELWITRLFWSKISSSYLPTKHVLTYYKVCLSQAILVRFHKVCFLWTRKRMLIGISCLSGGWRYRAWLQLKVSINVTTVIALLGFS